MKKIFLSFAIVVFMILIYVIYPEKKTEKYIATVEVSEVKLGKIDDTHVFSGVLKSDKEVQVAGEVGGRIQSLKIEVGDRVEIGESLAYIDNKINSATALGVQNSLNKMAKLTDDTSSLFDEKIKSTAETNSNIKTKNITLITNTAIFTSQVNDYLSELLVIRNGIRNFKSSDISNNLGALSSVSKTNAENSFIKYEANFTEFKNYFDEKIINKNPTQGEVEKALLLSEKVLLQSKVALQDVYTMLTFTLTGNYISESGLANYKTTILTFGSSAENLLDSLQNTGSQINQTEIGLNSASKEKNAKLSEIDGQVSEIEMQSFINNAMLGMQNILAPISGVIIQKNIEEGSVVNAGTPIFVLADDTKLKLEIDVPQTLINIINVGQEVEVDLGTKVIIATISKIHPSINPINGKNKIEIAIDNYDRKYKIGSFAKVILASSEPDSKEESIVNKSILVPKESLITKYGETYVFIIENNRAIKRNIKIGESNDDFLEVLEGLLIEDKVITTGAKYLRDGDQITFKN